MTPTEANAIIAMGLARGRFEDTFTPVPGWKFIGEGACRSVWLAPDGWVYKVAHDEDPWGNQPEYSNYLQWHRRLPEGLVMPQTEDFYVADEAVDGDEMLVLAMEYIDYDDHDYEVHEKFENFILYTMCLWDCNSDNVATKNGTMYLLDFAC